MDLELKEFEEKINNITEQFMSLLNSNEGINESVGNKFESTSTKIENEFKEPTIFNNITDGIGTTSSYAGVGSTYNNVIGSSLNIGAGDINFGGIKYGTNNETIGNIPGHAIKFDSVEYDQLNTKLEDLYNTKKDYTPNTYTGNPNIAFSDSNLRRAKSMDNATYGNYNVGDNTYNTGYTTTGYTIDTGNNSSSYTNDKTCSTLNDKEVYEMANNNGVENSGNPFYSFATIPADKSLVERKNWKDVLFMDIPWDTKIDLWGGFKKFCTAQIKITF